MAKAVVKENPLIEEVKTDAQLARVWERRLLNPLHQDNVGITIKDGKSWELHWIESANPGRYHTAVRELGWVPVRPDELEDAIDALGLVDHKDGMVRRGIKGSEILVKMPVKVFERIRRRKAEVNLQRVRKTRETLAQTAAQRFGDQAGEFVMGKGNIERDGVGGLKGKIVDGLEETA